MKFPLLLAVAVLLLVMDGCMQFRMTNTEIKGVFEKYNNTATFSTLALQGRQIRFAESGNPAGPVVLFVHGSPGSLSDFLHTLNSKSLQQQAHLISVDRPGFGESDFGRGEPSLQRQAELLKPIVAKFKQGKRLILVGHSLGGPVIARMAMDYPELIDGLVFVAASVDPNLEPPNWWRAPFATPFFRWMLPRSIRASNDEIYPLRKELTAMSTQWKKINCPAIVVQGTRDSLVPHLNALYISDKMGPKAEIRYEDGMDHFVPWSHPHLIEQAVLRLLPGPQNP